MQINKEIKYVYSLILLSLWGVICIMATMANIDKSVDLIEKSILLTCVLMVLYCFKEIKKRFALFLFSVCVFTFLIAKIMLGYFTGEENWNFGLGTSGVIIGVNTLILTLLSLLVGSLLSEKLKIGARLSVGRIFSDDIYNFDTLRKINICIYVCSMLIRLYYSINKAVYSLLNGYLSLYTTYTKGTWEGRVALVFEASLFIGLASNPSRRKMWFYIITGFISPILTLIQGARGELVNYILFVVYYIYTNNVTIIKSRHPKKSYKKYILIGIVAAYFILPFLYNYGHTRSIMADNGSESSGIEGIKNFFYEQSTSFSLIKYAIIYKGKLPQKYYSLGALLNLFSKNKYGGQNVSNALYGRSFGDVISYYVIKSAYLHNGNGLGSSYIAELYYDFDYIGVIIGNLFIGFFLSGCSNKNISKGSLLKSVGYYMLYMSFALPRSALLKPFLPLLSTSVIATYLLVFALSVKHRKNKRN